MRQPTNHVRNDEVSRAVLDATYRESSYSNGSGNCVSLAVCGGFVGAQDSKLPSADRRANTLVFSSDAMHGFLRQQRSR